MHLRLMIRARAKAAAHIWFGFRPGDHQIWRIYRFWGLETLQVFCCCGKRFE